MLQEHCYLTSIIGLPVVTENFIVCVCTEASFPAEMHSAL